MAELPSTAHLFTRQQLIERHPNLLNESRLKWALRNREKNGLKPHVYEARSGELLINEPQFLEWFLGLSGRNKPRAPRHKRAQKQ